MGVVYLQTKHQLTKWEARWVEFLADYDFTVHHKPGKCNIADPLSRRPDLREGSLDFGNGAGVQSDTGQELNAIEYWR